MWGFQQNGQKTDSFWPKMAHYSKKLGFPASKLGHKAKMWSKDGSFGMKSICQAFRIQVLVSFLYLIGWNGVILTPKWVLKQKIAVLTPRMLYDQNKCHSWGASEANWILKNGDSCQFFIHWVSNGTQRAQKTQISPSTTLVAIAQNFSTTPGWIF